MRTARPEKLLREIAIRYDALEPALRNRWFTFIWYPGEADSQAIQALLRHRFSFGRSITDPEHFVLYCLFFAEAFEQGSLS